MCRIGLPYVFQQKLTFHRECVKVLMQQAAVQTTAIGPKRRFVNHQQVGLGNLFAQGPIYSMDLRRNEVPQLVTKIAARAKVNPQDEPKRQQAGHNLGMSSGQMPEAGSGQTGQSGATEASGSESG